MEGFAKLEDNTPLGRATVIYPFNNFIKNNTYIINGILYKCRVILNHFADNRTVYSFFKEAVVPVNKSIPQILSLYKKITPIENKYYSDKGFTKEITNIFSISPPNLTSAQKIAKYNTMPPMTSENVAHRLLNRHITRNINKGKNYIHKKTYNIPKIGKSHLSTRRRKNRRK
jgi:hypothetical protein